MNPKTIVLLLLLAAILIGGIGYYNYSKPTPSANELKTDFSFSAKDFYQEFDTNEEVATQKYQNKVIEVEGNVDSTFSNDQGGKIILINSEGGMGNIIFELDTSINLSKTYTKGDRLKLKGICSGKLIDVVLNRSIVIKKI